jgi:hypothetical protein
LTRELKVEQEIGDGNNEKRARETWNVTPCKGGFLFKDGREDLPYWFIPLLAKGE